jgi:hypothetical protein
MMTNKVFVDQTKAQQKDLHGNNPFTLIAVEKAQLAIQPFNTAIAWYSLTCSQKSELRVVDVIFVAFESTSVPHPYINIKRSMCHSKSHSLRTLTSRMLRECRVTIDHSQFTHY